MDRSLYRLSRGMNCLTMQRLVFDNARVIHVCGTRPQQDVPDIEFCAQQRRIQILGTARPTADDDPDDIGNEKPKLLFRLFCCYDFLLAKYTPSRIIPVAPNCVRFSFSPSNIPQSKATIGMV